jgi:hypothetical protein
VKRRIQKRRVHAEGGGLTPPLGRQGHLGEELIPTPPSGLQALEDRPIFKAPLGQDVIEAVNLHDL